MNMETGFNEHSPWPDTTKDSTTMAAIKRIKTQLKVSDKHQLHPDPLGEHGLTYDREAREWFFLHNGQRQIIPRIRISERLGLTTDLAILAWECEADTLHKKETT